MATVKGGIVFVKGYKPTEQQKRLAQERRRKTMGTFVCPYCKKTVNRWAKKQYSCGSRACVVARNRAARDVLAKTNPLRHLAWRLTGTIRLSHKIDIVEKMLRDAVNQPCCYCGRIVTAEVASLDHKEPRSYAKVYSRELKRKVYGDEELRRLDSKDNLQIVCRDCNQLKSDMNDEQFRVYLQFSEARPDIAQKINKRLSFARGNWKRLSKFR